MSELGNTRSESQGEEPERSTAKFSFDSPTPLNVAKLGRYEVIRPIGAGGFGQVHLARDPELDRLVAIKVPNSRKFRTPNLIENLLAEAKMAAGLRHEGIVTVFDVGWEGDNPYIVMEFVQGRTLAEFMKTESWTYEFAAQMMADIALGLQHAHEKGFIHRDLKPPNVLLDADDRPRITDFGLAIQERDLATDSQMVAGTLMYMAPEQASGEKHRIDRRTDVWALGVMLYQLLCRKLPFEGESRTDITTKILRAEYSRPTLLNADVPAELDRICVRCISRRMSQRYASAKEFADDLLMWVTSTQRASGSPQTQSDHNSLSSNECSPLMVPRGLRSFKSEDANFFLRLLPGPRDRSGLPLSISFWVNSICDSHDSQAMQIGMLYGPSGSGKSSFITAGVLPLLGESIGHAYFDATKPDFLNSFCNKLRSDYAIPPTFTELPRVVAELRDRFSRGEANVGASKKLVVFIDQFEQLLAAQDFSVVHPLVQSLRQCDGTYVQCILIARDDFWPEIRRFMSLLEINVIDGENAMPLETFDPEHGKKVLYELGRSLNCLPHLEAEMTQTQIDFVDRAIRELAENGGLYPVRIAIFGELVSKQPWSIATLDQLGGVAGIAVAYLDHSVGNLASSARQVHREAAKRVLAELLPSDGDIKRAAVPRAALLEASGYAESLKDFDLLMRLLDGELRLLTPVSVFENSHESTGEITSNSDSQSQVFDRKVHGYRLTHDYFVPAIRQWLDRDLLSERSGRQWLLLKQQAAIWSERHSARFLPNLSEYLQFLYHTRKKQWTTQQADMMRAAARRISRSALIVTSLCVFAAIVFGVYQNHKNNQAAQKESDQLIADLQEEDVSKVPGTLARLNELSKFSAEGASKVFSDMSLPARARFRAGLLAAIYDPAIREKLVELIANEDLSLLEIQTNATYLKSLQSLADDHGFRWFDDDHLSPSSQLRLAAVLAQLSPSHPELPELHEDITQTLIELPLAEALAAISLFSGIGDALQDSLRKAYASDQSPTSALVTVRALLTYKHDPSRFAPCLLETANSFQFREILRFHSEHREDLLKWIESHDIQATDSQVRDLAQANLAIGAALLGNLRRLQTIANERYSPLRTKTIAMFDPGRLDIGELMDLMYKAQEKVPLESMLILGSDKFVERTLSQRQRQRLGMIFQKAFKNSDVELHAAADLMASRWEVDLPAVKPTGGNAELAKLSNRNWYVNSTNQQLIVLDIPKSESHEAYRVALGATEVPNELFAMFEREVYPEDTKLQSSPFPVAGRTVSRTCSFYNWLSKKDGIQDDQLIFVPQTPGETNGNFVIADCMLRRGYRPPTAEEWKVAIGVLAQSWIARCPPKVSENYVWGRLNASFSVHPVATRFPNPNGFFDLFGNASELVFLNKNQDKPAMEATYGIAGGSWQTFSNGETLDDHVVKFNILVLDATVGLRLARRLPDSEDENKRN